ncbi:MAG: hypothetical protein MZW92_04220 [Comamonadaceae bacterium]|nr:hypothetical protein [Comamonadaceae bacterium]
MRFDPASQPIFNVAVLADSTARRSAAGADHLGRPGAAKAPGERARRRLGDAGRRRRSAEVNVYLQARRRWRRWASASTRWPPRCAARTRSRRWAALRSPRAGARGADRRAAAAPARTSRDIIVARNATAAPVRLWQVARRGRRPAGGGEPGALQRPAHRAAVGAEEPGREHDRGRRRPASARSTSRSRCCRRACATEVNRDSSRPIRVAVANVQRTLLEGALLTIADRLPVPELAGARTVITGLTLPIALIGTFLFMYAVRLHASTSSR